ncbi:hypothetical protein TEQG_07490 [Trichophyton equinum CBS 127.97]|uniref:Uncharacterized protein n=1 Tax=Trichophyton equinum (strain ATCC MYA-4606 / CBS 127.97) TaxID=559882 RepID=F2Q2L2_TRIEC|nr:hypothetical protein TEQG_07490 [Trichophyton equinum CBS 127.97]
MQDSLPITPNFFLEAKGPNGSPAVATRQAYYNGALGARGIRRLRLYNILKLYTTHPTTPRESDGRPEYIITQLKVVLEDSDTLATCDEAEFYDTEWSFTHPNDGAEDLASNKHARAESTSSNGRKCLQN